MVSDAYPQAPLETVAESINVGYVGPMAREYLPQGIPFLRSLNVAPYRVLRDDLKFISPAFHEQLRKSALRPGDVVIVRTGVPGTAAVIPEDLPVSNCSDVVVVRPGPRLNPRFLTYFFNSQSGRDTVHARVVGSVQRHFNIGDARRSIVPVPSRREQDAIAHILGTLDDKIELNRRMNETLEAMARAIFKSWFADFDPVRAKAEGRKPPGLAPEIAKLFPSGFQESPIGQIPKGWRVAGLGDLVDLEYGKALKESVRKAGTVPVYGSNGQIGWHDTPLVAGPGIVVGRKGNPGVVTWAPKDFFCIDTTFYVVPKGQARRSLHFIFYALVWHDLASLGADSAVPGLNRNVAYMSRQLVPDASVCGAFEAFAGPIFCGIHAAAEQSRTLAALRDTLLPKLLSGELRVPDADKFLEKAGVPL